MHAEDVSPTLHTVGERGKRAREALAWRAPGERPDEVLARDRHQQRTTERMQAREVCEQRDPKGHYRKARAGELKNFTGTNGNYEPPKSPELIADSGSHSVAELSDAIEHMLS